MIKLIKKTFPVVTVIVSILFIIIPEKALEQHQWITSKMLEKLNLNNTFSVDGINLIISKILCIIITIILSIIIYKIYLCIRKKIKIKGKNYEIIVEYGDIFKIKNCRKVINFDECFTTTVGVKPEYIKPGTICGQYLLNNPNLNIKKLIKDNGIKMEKTPSKYKNKNRYASGTIIPNDDYLLMAFAKLDARGKGRFFERDEYLECLNLLWEEIEIYYAKKDVCIPILGSGLTAFNCATESPISQQELLDIMILSYKLSSHKIKYPNKLHIVCMKAANFSINDINI